MIWPLGQVEMKNVVLYVLIGSRFRVQGSKVEKAEYRMNSPCSYVPISTFVSTIIYKGSAKIPERLLTNWPVGFT